MTVTVEGPPKNEVKLDRPRITTVIFDVDDTLYDVGTVSAVIIASRGHFHACVLFLRG